MSCHFFHLITYLHFHYIFSEYSVPDFLLPIWSYVFICLILELRCLLTCTINISFKLLSVSIKAVTVCFPTSPHFSLLWHHVYILCSCFSLCSNKLCLSVSFIFILSTIRCCSQVNLILVILVFCFFFFFHSIIRLSHFF